MKTSRQLPTPEERHRMIAAAAYFRAEKRGFNGQDPVNDWLAAEAEIDQSLKHLRDGEPRKQERAAYERMRRELKKILANTQDTVNADTIRHAFDKVSSELKELGEFVPEAVDKAGKKLRREVAAAIEKMGPRLEAFSGRGLELFESWKDRGGNFLNQASKALDDWVRRYRRKGLRDTGRNGPAPSPRKRHKGARR